ncbi:glycine zipper 2TM domain-containing protein [Actinobacillus pleuropneumoniae]|uniref:Outer membrane lipoprotein n=6 Tax=Actinobacillus pleuropneumoniae TaxID=715 RepID=A3MYA9_ACTP2|nr:glycine zipper 2TM domain-containing protein [Actinobacillus pleuropneumoniae]ABN73145.1 outer membrane lipoprotein [Actinobacillus pleuropneumoniae serovar 5b str. L20]ABY68644.1 outer membrane lipoprotein [Actinobacillus pleuropneumoniae serovar 3 str. JL03]ACE60689.1 outer membrane lipoprotein [Actinobacillus pleuropneumoniae serovar 7 str. AP76]ASU15956.1 Outer membrane lipoprotein pcp [Actinobacillus pleuropneumoniae]AWG94457.1 glycine zipper 2TM domain-containing protein [Actinobacill
MKKFSLAAALFTSLTLVGCANTDIYSGSVYNSSQAKEARSISYGTIVSVRDVKIQADNQGVLGTLGGGALGGITGSTIGGGSGRAVATAVGAIAGAVIGSTIEEKVSQVSSLEMVIRKDDGKEIVVVQKKEDGFVPGKRVRIVGSNSDLNVSVL